jgi:hypothetical protein
VSPPDSPLGRDDLVKGHGQPLGLGKRPRVFEFALNLADAKLDNSRAAYSSVSQVHDEPSFV